MTLNKLSQLYYLNREIESDKRRLAKLEAKAQPSSPAFSDMPRAQGTTDKVGKYSAEAADLITIIEEKQRRCIAERAKLEAYIAEIPDSLTRMIFTYRFVNGLSWAQVAYSIGGGNTAENVRQIARRYVAKN